MGRKVALLFPGQGSQYVGMGKDFDLNVNFEKALGYDLLNIMNNGPEDVLKLTANAQPAIVAASLNLYSKILPILEQAGAEVEIVMGHSVGEYAALAASGFFSFEDAIKLVHARGKFMQEAVPAGKGKMIAILRADAQIIEQACKQVSTSESKVQPANYNEPGQIVISGHAEACDKAAELIKQLSSGPIRAVELQVSAPFHCQLMQPAAHEMKILLEKTATQSLRYPYVANINAQKITTSTPASTIINNLYEQIAGAVCWYQSFEHVPKNTLCLEVGPGKVLTGMARRINPELEFLAMDSDKALTELKEKL